VKKISARTVAAKPNPNWRNKPMMSKATRKLVLKKELLRTLDERHLRVVNGGRVPFGFASSGVDECLLSVLILAPEAAPM
jgi:hypothetical protein